MTSLPASSELRLTRRFVCHLVSVCIGTFSNILQGDFIVYWVSPFTLGIWSQEASYQDTYCHAKEYSLYRALSAKWVLIHCSWSSHRTRVSEPTYIRLADTEIKHQRGWAICPVHGRTLIWNYIADSKCYDFIFIYFPFCWNARYYVFLSCSGSQALPLFILNPIISSLPPVQHFHHPKGPCGNSWAGILTVILPRTPVSSNSHSFTALTSKPWLDSSVHHEIYQKPSVTLFYWLHMWNKYLSIYTFWTLDF